jgi:phosphoribosylglycinamide formyltransferase-1
MNDEARTTVLLSGRGSNLKALIQHQSGYKITHVVTDKPEAPGLQLAIEAGIPTSVVPRSEFPSLSAFKAAVLKTVAASRPDIVALAGFMVVLQPEFIDTFHGRLINIHPSLLPMFPGLHTHERALEAKVARHGCTVHFVDAGIDTGPLIAQAAVDIEPNDSPESLAARVLAKEHTLYPWIVRAIAQGDIRLQGRSLTYSDRARTEAKRMGATIFS